MLPLDNCPDCVVSFGENLIRIDSVCSVAFGYEGDDVPEIIQYFIYVEYEFGKYTIHTGSKKDMYHFLMQLQEIHYISNISVPNINDFIEKLRTVWLSLKKEKEKQNKINIQKKDFDICNNITNNSLSEQQSDNKVVKKKKGSKQPRNKALKPLDNSVNKC